MKAGMRFTNDRLKDSFVDIEEILFNRRDDDHIKPKDVDDYDPKHLYSVYWCYCETDDCTDDGKLCKYYKGYIFGLGETKEEILKKHEESGIRIAFKNNKAISESDYSDETSQSQKSKKATKTEEKRIAGCVWKTNSEKITEKYKFQNFLNSRKKLESSFSGKNGSQRKEDSVMKLDNSNVKVTLMKLPTVAQGSVKTGKSMETKQGYENHERHLSQSDDEVSNRSESMLRKRRSLLTDNDGLQKQGQNCNDVNPHNHNNAGSANGNDVNMHWNENDEELACPLEELSDDGSSDEPENLDELQNDPNWGHIKVYKYKLFKYLKKQPVRPQPNEQALDAEPALYSEENNTIYLGLGIRTGSLTWRITKSKKDDLFLRDTALLIWRKAVLSNRCLKLARVNNSIPERSPVKTVTPQKLNHFLRLYRNHLVDKKYAEDKIRFYMRKATGALSCEIRDLRSKAMKKANKRIRQRENQRLD